MTEEAFTGQFIGKKGPFTYGTNGIDAASGATHTSEAALKAINRAFEENAETGLKKGDVITFGHYEQDNVLSNGPEGIEWYVLKYDEKEHRALLFSKYCLDMQPYHKEQTAVTWENCSLREWLNGEFLNSAFTAEEQSAILLTNVDNSSGQGYFMWNTDGGKDTKDRIFLLSDEESAQYLWHSTVGRKLSFAVPTPYAIGRGAVASDYCTNEEGEPPGYWWTRSPGKEQDQAIHYLFYDERSTDDVNSDWITVRPVLWVKTDTD